MNALEAAKALATLQEPTALEYEIGEDRYVLAFCGANPSGPHLPQCPWLALPQIVAVLEAAERLIDATAYPPAAYHEWQAFVTALKGEVPA